MLQKDLRLLLGLQCSFDLTTCTEVAEHIEPQFAATLVHSLTEAADVLWFSSEAPKWVLDNDDNIHHSNEQPQVLSSWPVCFQQSLVCTLPSLSFYYIMSSAPGGPPRPWGLHGPH